MKLHSIKDICRRFKCAELAGGKTMSLMFVTTADLVGRGFEASNYVRII